MEEKIDFQIIENYEKFLSQKLAPKLTSLVNDRQKLVDEINGYIDLENMLIEREQHSINEDYHTLIDIGGGIKMQAKVDSKQLSTSSSSTSDQEIFIHIGLGIHIPLSSTECLEFISSRVPLLERRLSGVQENCNKIIMDIENSKALIDEAKAYNNNNNNNNNNNSSNNTS